MPNRYLPLFVTLVVLSCSAAWAQSNEQMLKEFADKLETTNGRKPTRFELEDICEKLSTIIKESPANAEALRLRSVARVEVGEPQGALEDIAASLTLEPKNVKALTQNAIIKSFSDDPAGAIKAYEDAIKAGADTALVYTNMGSLYERVGQPAKAIECFDKAIAREGGKASDLARALRAIALTNAKEYEKSISDCDIALKTNLPGMLVNELHKTRGMDLFFLSRYKEALVEFDIAANTMPDGPGKGLVVFVRGACRDKLGDKEKALEDLALSQKLGFRKPGSPPPDRVAPVDAELEHAVDPLIVQARKTLPQFKERCLKGMASGFRPSVTTRLRQGPRLEQVFVSVDSWRDNVIKGRLLSQVKLTNYKLGQTVEVPEAEVIDWTIVDPHGVEEGNLIGKFIDQWIDKKKPEEDKK